MPQRQRILGIDPGTREMGLALLEGHDLVYHDVHVFLHRESPHTILKEGRATILRLIRDFTPDVLTFEKTFFANNRNAALLNVLSDEIRAVAKRKRIPVRAYAPSTVKKRVTGNGRASKGEVAQVVVSHYPELKVYQSEDRKWKALFHANRFDAIAVGLVALEEH